MAKMRTPSTRNVRCAVYTRKSHEEGLEQDFNSLDAQREACEAFVLSQKHAGWQALPAMYDDGGVSGATLERPALQRLLDDVRARQLDVIVVYKVDRLTAAGSATPRAEPGRTKDEPRRGGAEPAHRLLYDGHGHRMTPTHAVKNGRRYRYYVSTPLITRSRSAIPGGWRVPAADLEQLVADRLCGFLSSEGEVYHAIEPHLARGCPVPRLIIRAGELAAEWYDLPPADRRAVLGAVVTRIGVHPELKRVGLGIKMVVAGARSREPDPSLMKLFIKAHHLQGRFLQGNSASIAEFARREGMSESHITRHLRLAFVAPDIVKAILAGQHPPTLTAAKLIRDTRLPLDWPAQRAALGFD